MKPEKNAVAARNEPRWPLAAVLAINAAIGGAFACYLFSGAFFAGNVSAFLWPQGDMEMFTTGGRYFIHDAWRFPLFISTFVQRSYPQSMAFTDCVPLFALIAKIIYKTTGHEIAYLGWWYPFVIVAQPIAFSFLLWFGGVRNRLLLIAGGLFSLLIPAFLYRVGHAALFGHFTIVMAMALYFAATAPGQGRQGWPRWLLLAWPLWLLLCATINVYLLAMAGLFFAVALGQSALTDYAQGRGLMIRQRALYAACVLGAVGALMFVLGFFVPYMGGGEFGIHSTNLISPFVPQLTTLFTNSMKIVDATGGQYEGYNYFGAGFLGLILVAAAIGDDRPWRLVARHPILACALAGLTLLALSNIAYAGRIMLWSVHVPRFFQNFRSSGRFIWPVTYFCLFLTLYALDGRRPIGRVFILVVACLLLQWQDMRFLSDGLWNLGHATKRPALANDPVALRALIARHRGVYMAPDFACVKSKTANDTIMDIGWYAALELKPINTIYFARNPVDTRCTIDRAVMNQKRAQNDLVISFYDPGAAVNPLAGAGCGKLGDDATVCVASQSVTVTDDLVRRLFTPQ